MKKQLFNTVPFLLIAVILITATFCKKELSKPIVSTNSLSDITQTTATGGGEVTFDGGAKVTSRGVCWSTIQNPQNSDTHTEDGSGSGSFTSSLTNLTPGSTYYVRGYATNSVGTAYGNQIYFTSLSGIPSVSTNDIKNILETTAIAGGIVTSNGGSEVTERGICYSLIPNPTIMESKKSSGNGNGTFNCPLDILIPYVTYHVRAYAINRYGVAYGENKTFTTMDAYYVGFEEGMPSGWTGTWTISVNHSYEGFYSLLSWNRDDVIEFSRTVNNPEGGYISFFYYTDWGDCTDFYIDNVKQQPSACSINWRKHTYKITSGLHKFKWIHASGGFPSCYIDYIICTK